MTDHPDFEIFKVLKHTYQIEQSRLSHEILEFDKCMQTHVRFSYISFYFLHVCTYEKNEKHMAYMRCAYMPSVTRHIQPCISMTGFVRRDLQILKPQTPRLACPPIAILMVSTKQNFYNTWMDDENTMGSSILEGLRFQNLQINSKTRVDKRRCGKSIFDAPYVACVHMAYVFHFSLYTHTYRIWRSLAKKISLLLAYCVHHTIVL